MIACDRMRNVSIRTESLFYEGGNRSRIINNENVHCVRYEVRVEGTQEGENEVGNFCYDYRCIDLVTASLVIL